MHGGAVQCNVKFFAENAVDPKYTRLASIACDGFIGNTFDVFL